MFTTIDENNYYTRTPNVTAYYKRDDGNFYGATEVQQGLLNFLDKLKLKSIPKIVSFTFSFSTHVTGSFVVIDPSAGTSHTIVNPPVIARPKKSKQHKIGFSREERMTFRNKAFLQPRNTGR